MEIILTFAGVLCLGHIGMVMLKVSKKEKEFIEWVNK